jgi:hypothetical protein
VFLIKVTLLIAAACLMSAIHLYRYLLWLSPQNFASDDTKVEGSSGASEVRSCQMADVKWSSDGA